MSRTACRCNHFRGPRWRRARSWASRDATQAGDNMCLAMSSDLHAATAPTSVEAPGRQSFVALVSARSGTVSPSTISRVFFDVNMVSTCAGRFLQACFHVSARAFLDRTWMRGTGFCLVLRAPPGDRTRLALLAPGRQVCEYRPHVAGTFRNLSRSDIVPPPGDAQFI